MTGDYFRYLLHAKAEKVTCQPFSYMKIKTVPHLYHKNAHFTQQEGHSCLTFYNKVQIHEQPNADTVIMDDTTMINV